MSTDTTAFEGLDSSVFREWAMGLSDVLANCKSEHCAPESINAAGRKGCTRPYTVAKDICDHSGVFSKIFCTQPDCRSSR